MTHSDRVRDRFLDTHTEQNSRYLNRGCAACARSTAVQCCSKPRDNDTAGWNDTTRSRAWTWIVPARRYPN